jgi:cytochrome c-type biogenesis protein CcmH/NrfG
LKPPSRESRAEAVALFERALALDPDSVAAQSWLGIELTARVKLPRFRGVLASLVDHASVGWTSIACS